MRARILLASICFGWMWASAASAAPEPLGTQFTYQGYLENDGIPVVGLYDLQFRLYDGADAQTAVELDRLQQCDVEISEGIFSVPLDFGAALFDGEARWLEIGLSPADSSNPCDDSLPFTYLEPLQEITATPYALFALTGNEGPQGPAGSQWLIGEGEPDPSLGADGDLYLDNGSGDVFQKTAGSWGLVANLTGPMGSSPFQSDGDDIFYTAGSVGLGTTQPDALFEVEGDSVLFSGSLGTGTLPVEGAGVRMLWYPGKAAFRAGQATSDQWDDDKIGQYSMGLGLNTTASGAGSVALGHGTEATGQEATALGRNTSASGQFSTALGHGSLATGPTSTATGASTTASGAFSFTAGFLTRATQNNSAAWGMGSLASGSQATAMGDQTIASGDNSLALGLGVEARAFSSVAMGRYNEFGGSPNSWQPLDHLFVIGIGSGDADRENAVTVLKNGSVGIGNSAPNHALDVAGDIQATGSICGSNGCLGDLAGSPTSSVVVQGTRASEAESGTQTLFHGLGAVPSEVEIAAVAGLREASMTSFGYSDGTNNFCSFVRGESHVGGNSSSHAVYIRYDKDGSITSVYQLATLTFDESHITIHWQSGGDSGFVDDFTISFTIRARL